MSQAVDDPIHEVMELLFTFAYELHKTAARQWWDIDLTMAQFKVLLTLVVEGQVAIGTIAETLGIGAPTASHLVDRLVQAGLVERVEYSADRRYTLAHLTPQGETMMRRLQQGRMDQLQSYLARLDAQDLAALRQGLTALVNILSSVPSQQKEIGRI
jgi:DNA-binding MarR family transcriptional regulator